LANSPFPGFPDEAIRFFKGLARNNRREWFQPRKPAFDEQVKKPMVELCEVLNLALKRFAPAYVTDPAKAVYRIYRDTRFSNDKTPYKDHIAASFRHKSLVGDGGGAGFYFQVSHKDVSVGGGIYMPSPETLLAVRHHLAEHHEAFNKVLASRSLKRLLGDIQGDQLSRAPKGFPTNHPAADILRRKQLYYFTELPADLATTPAIYKEIVTRFEAMAPFLEFLNAPLTGRESNQQSAFSNQPRAEGAHARRRTRPS
jgi:uncharacterized protein (TIGR02453 family)